MDDTNTVPAADTAATTPDMPTTETPVEAPAETPAA